ncbi:MAG: MerR family DNA-binding transcriptional regulator [Nostocoides sp.]
MPRAAAPSKGGAASPNPAKRAASARSTGRSSATRSASGKPLKAAPETAQEAEPIEQLSIGELAELTEVSTRTIRYYEELGILPEPTRTPGGTRRYPREYAFYVEGAKLLKQLGFGLEEIAEIGQFALTGAAASDQTRGILKRKLADLDHRIRVLTKLYDVVAQAAGGSQTQAMPVGKLLQWLSASAAEEEAEAASSNKRRGRTSQGTKG